MAFQPAPNVVEIDINMILDDQLCQNTLYATSISPEPDNIALAILAASVEEWWTDFYAPFVGTGVRLRDVEVKGLWAQDAPYAMAPGGTLGLVNSPMLPNHNTWCVKFTTGLIGRSQRGRNYIVGLTEGQVVGNEISGALAATIVSAYNNLPDFFDVGGFVWVILSRYTNGAEREAGVAFPVTGVSYEDLYIDSQRRRLPGRGR